MLVDPFPKVTKSLLNHQSGWLKKPCKNQSSPAFATHVPSSRLLPFLAAESICQQRSYPPLWRFAHLQRRCQSPCQTRLRCHGDKLVLEIARGILAYMVLYQSQYVLLYYSSFLMPIISDMKVHLSYNFLAGFYNFLAGLITWQLCIANTSAWFHSFLQAPMATSIICASIRQLRCCTSRNNSRACDTEPLCWHTWAVALELNIVGPNLGRIWRQCQRKQEIWINLEQNISRPLKPHQLQPTPSHLHCWKEIRLADQLRPWSPGLAEVKQMDRLAPIMCLDHGNQKRLSGVHACFPQAIGMETDGRW